MRQLTGGEVDPLNLLDSSGAGYRIRTLTPVMYKSEGLPAEYSGLRQVSFRAGVRPCLSAIAMPVVFALRRSFIIATQARFPTGLPGGGGAGRRCRCKGFAPIGPTRPFLPSEPARFLLSTGWRMSAIRSGKRPEMGTELR